MDLVAAKIIKGGIEILHLDWWANLTFTNILTGGRGGGGANPGTGGLGGG